MKKITLIFSLVFTLVLAGSLTAALRDNGDNEPVSEEMAEEEIMAAQKALEEMEAYAVQKNQVQKKVKKRKKNLLRGDEGFIAGPEWEFDGFVVGGQGQDVRSMFVVNDLIYLNVGYVQGFQPGDRLGFYKRGHKIKDPQSGRFLGYEVQRIGTGEITNKIEDETCSVRVIASNDGIEIGDLVRQDR